MISCTEFIPAYSELFTFLEDKHGRDEVDRFWEYLTNLGNQQKTIFIKGEKIFYSTKIVAQIMVLQVDLFLLKN